MAAQWNAALYEDAHSFVWKLAGDLLPLLNPKSGERIVDLGCGTGHLTAEIARTGATVIGIDSSEDMIARARSSYPDIEFRVSDARSFTIGDPGDAVFSNAALHWVTDAEAAVKCISRALKPGGRFVAEFGGKGNISKLLAGTLSVLQEHGIDVQNPWYFPSVGEYAPLLERYGLEVRQAALFDRMTALEEGDDGIQKWLDMFGTPIFTAVPQDASTGIRNEIAARLRPELFREGRWYADYRRIRVVAVKAG